MTVNGHVNVAWLVQLMSITRASIPPTTKFDIYLCFFCGQQAAGHAGTQAETQTAGHGGGGGAGGGGAGAPNGPGGPFGPAGPAGPGGPGGPGGPPGPGAPAGPGSPAGPAGPGAPRGPGAPGGPGGGGGGAGAAGTQHTGKQAGAQALGHGAAHALGDLLSFSRGIPAIHTPITAKNTTSLASMIMYVLDLA